MTSNLILNDELKSLVYDRIKSVAALDTFSGSELDPLRWSPPEGKMLRPALVFATSDNTGDPVTVDCAAAVHLIHCASLILDDIHDSDTVRHSKPSCWVIAGTNQAMNLGNFLFTSALRLLLNTEIEAQKRLLLVSSAVECISSMIEGQMMDLHFPDSDHTTDYYLRCVRGKTGALFGLCVSLSAICNGIDEKLRNSTMEHFTDLGCAYQLCDDIIDMEGQKEMRQKGSDIITGRCTIAACVPSGTGHAHNVYNFMNDFMRSIKPLPASSGVHLKNISQEFKDIFLNRSFKPLCI